MAQATYQGTYGRFEALDKSQVAHLLGSDCLVGDELVYSVERTEAHTTVFVDNRFGGRVGKLDNATGEAVQLALAKGWQVHVLLASVYAQQRKKTNLYWGEVYVLAYAPGAADAFDTFCANVGEMLGDGVRVEIDLAQASVDKVLESGGAWVPTGRHNAPAVNGSVLVKSHRTINEKLVELARKRNPGCMAMGWAFIVVLVVLVLWGLKQFFGF